MTSKKGRIPAFKLVKKSNNVYCILLKRFNGWYVEGDFLRSRYSNSSINLVDNTGSISALHKDLHSDALKAHSYLVEKGLK